MNETLEYLGMVARLPFALRRFLRHRLTLEEAKAIVRQRMEHREENFLRTVEGTVYRYPRSPYLPLLRMAGCELGDLRALVRQQGLEGALFALREEGVYVNFEEFKGRRPIVRGNTTFAVTTRDFDNPSSRRDFAVQTGGSTGAAASVGVDLDHTAARASHRVITLAAHGLIGAPIALWIGILPGRGLSHMLFGGYTGIMPERWFSPIGRHDSRYWLKYDLMTYYTLLCLRLVGVSTPLPEYVRDDQAVVVAQWVADTIKEHGRCLLRTGVSRGVRVCLAAQAAGLDLTGAAITGGGEPPTPAKVDQMTRSGVRYIPNYGMTEAGQPGSGCVHPVDGSDVHLFKDTLALFTYPHYVENFDVSVPAFHLTTLLPTAPKVMLNVQTDDYGIVEERRCGCELETYGLTTHLRQIRSYAKLTGEGVTLIGTEMQHILEEVLPARFGGSPLDYQLMEEEDDKGFTRLSLIISPSVHIADEQMVIEFLLQELRKSSPMADAARTVWQQTQTLQVKRMQPVLTERGKLLPLHIRRRHADSTKQRRDRQ